MSNLSWEKIFEVLEKNSSVGAWIRITKKFSKFFFVKIIQVHEKKIAEKSTFVFGEILEKLN